MTRLRNIFAAAAAFVSLALPGAALAQSGCQYINANPRNVLTPAQWQFCFTSKQDALGYTPVNSAGATMTGRLVTSASSAVRAGFNLPAGTAPTTPVDGDVWTTTAGLFARINGATVGPFGAGSVTSTTNSDGTLTISPTTGAVVASINLSHANTWAATQTFSAAVSPTVTGGTAVGSTLTLQSTSGVGTTDAIIFKVGNAGATEGGRFVTGGQMVFGHTASLDFGQGISAFPRVQINSTTNVYGLGNAYWAADAVGPQLILAKSRGASVGTQTIVQANDVIGTLAFHGSSNTVFVPSASISAAIDATPGSGGDMPGRLMFSTTPDASSTGTPLLRMTINNSGQVVINKATAQSSVGTNRFEIHGWVSGGLARAGIYDWTNDNGTMSALSFYKSKSDAIGTQTIVASGSTLGQIVFNGTDGTNFLPGATISSFVDGTPGTNDMPGRITFATTADGASTPTDRVILDNTGSLKPAADGGTTLGRASTRWLNIILFPISAVNLPTCVAGLEGARYAVSDSNAASFTAGIGAVVAAGGTTHVPVYCDGTNWRIG